MLASRGNLAGELAECARNAANYVTSNYGNHADENAVTDEFLGIFGFQVQTHDWPNDVKVNAKRVRDRGANAVETRTGADFAVRFRFSQPNYEFRSGFLAQAKHYDTYDNDLDDLREDCGKMIAHSSASFLTTYSPSAFYHFPANGLHGLEEGAYDEIKNKRIHSNLYFRETKAFYNRFFRGIVGDRSVYENWEYLMEKIHRHKRRPAFPDGGGSELPPNDDLPPENIEKMEGGPGLSITMSVEG